MTAPWLTGQRFGNALLTNNLWHPFFTTPMQFTTIIYDENFQLVNEGVDRVPACFQAIFDRLYEEQRKNLKEEKPFSFLAYLTDFESEFPSHNNITSIANYLIKSARSYEDCQNTLKNIDATSCFRVLKVILRIAEPPILGIDYDFCRFAEKNNLACITDVSPEEVQIGIFPRSMLMKNDAKRDWISPHSSAHSIVVSSIVAEMRCHLFKTIQSMQSTFHRNLVRYLFYHLCNLVYECAYETRGNTHPDQPYFVALTASYNNFVARVIANISWELAEVLIRPDPLWVCGRVTYAKDKGLDNAEAWADEEKKQMCLRTMMNILCVGTAKIWFRGCTLKDFIHNTVTYGVVKGFEQKLHNTINEAEKRNTQPNAPGSSRTGNC